MQIMDKINCNILALENIFQCTWPVKCILITCLVFFLSLLSYLFIIKPNFLQYKLLIEQEKQLKVELVRKQSAANLKAYQEQTTTLQNKLTNLFKQSPNKEEVASLLAEISSIGLANGAIFDLFSPSVEVNHDFYRELPLTIDVMGTYSQLSQFLSKIVNLKYQLTISNLVINRISKNERSERENNLITMKIKLSILIGHHD